MSETTYKGYLKTKTKKELIDLIYQLHIDHIGLQQKHIKIIDWRMKQ